MKNPFFIFIILLLIQYRLCESSISKIILEILSRVFKLIINEKIISIQNILNEINCTKSIINLEQDDFVNTTFHNSGKSISDIGNERECQNKFAYFQVRFHLKDLSKLSNFEDQPVMEFLEQNFFYVGFCFPQKCENFFTQIVEKDMLFRNFIKEELKINEIYIHYHHIEYSSILQYIPTIFAILILLKMIVGIIRLIIFPDGYEAEFNKNYNEAIILNENKNKENTNILQNDLNENIINEINNINGNNNKNNISIKTLLSKSTSDDSYNPEFDNEGKFPIKLKTLKLIDMFDNIHNLTSQFNRYYNSNRINQLSTIKSIIMYFLVFNHIINANKDLPGKNFLNSQFYESNFFFFVKLSIYATTSWIMIDAALSSFKLMNYIKTELLINSKTQISGLSLFKFWLLSVPKIILFFFIYYLFHINGKYFEDYTGSKSMFNFYTEYVQNRYYCYREPSIIFSPKFFYIDFFKEKTKDILTKYEIPSPFFNNCFGFVNVYENEFYLFIIMIILFYFLIKYRNRRLEKIIFFSCIIYVILIPIFNYILITQSLLYKYPKDYKLSHILGENYSIKYPHLTICYYFFGFIIGICYFYNYHNKDNQDMNIDKEKIKDVNKKLPFYFCQNIVNKLKDLSSKLKVIFFWMIIIFILLLCFSFKFIQILYKNEEKKLLFEFNSFCLFIFHSEKFLFGILFFFLNLIIIVYPQDSLIQEILTIKNFVVLERISFCFNCVSHTLICVIFISFVHQFKISYLNTFFISIGFYLLLFLLSLILTILIEYPIRILFKWIIRNKLDVKSFENNLNKI